MNLGVEGLATRALGAVRSSAAIVLLLTGAPAPAAPGDEVELCDHGKVDENDLPPELSHAAGRAILDAAADLERSGEERSRALGMAMRAMHMALEATERTARWRAQNCFVTDACDEPTRQAQHAAGLPAAESLARMAAATVDPQVYATAMRVCGFIDREASGACLALRAEQWAQLDPDNSFAWLEVATAARRRGDREANDAAMRRASAAKVVDWRATPYGEFLARVDVRSRAVRALVLAQLDTAYAGEERFAPYVGVGAYCNEAQSTHPDRRATCGDLALLLAEQDPSLTGLQYAGSIALTRRHRASERLSRALQDFDTLSSIARRERANPTVDRLSCRWSVQTARWLQGVSRHGETGYLRILARDRPPPSPNPEGRRVRR
jgi:hypothetical protein